MKRLTPHEFIKKAKSIHGHKYDYREVRFVYASDKVPIICKEHGRFMQRPLHHLERGQGCPKCSRILIGDKNRMSLEDFIKRAKSIHGNRYSYEQVKYINSSTKVIITCPIHGDFDQTPTNHLKKHGCPACGGNKKADTAEFIEGAKKIHGDEYNYDKVNYKNGQTKVTITCIYHGDFKQRPNNHLRGNGCPRCNMSKGQNKIEKYLKEKGIKYELEYRFQECKNIRPLPYDFCISINNKIGLIEYQGEQHYEIIKFSNSNTQNREGIAERDEIKHNFAVEQKIPLLVISYKEYNEIEKILNKFIQKYFK